MQYPNIHPARFLSRPNRFVAWAELDGEKVKCHVKNTGRCRELLPPGAPVYLVECPSPKRSTRWDLVAVRKGDRLINMDSQVPNRVFEEWAAAGNFLPGLTLLRPETVYGDSRFDFYLEAGPRRGFVEVKGVTLEEDGAVRFPDAPTQRGVKHLEELIRAKRAGYEACLFFVVQMENVRYLAPNDATHPAFGEALRRAGAEGVRLLARDCRVTPDSLCMGKSVPIRLDES